MHKEDCTKEGCSHCCENCDCCKEQKLGVVDEALGKAVSRKLLVFACATGLLIWSGLDPDTWAMIAAMYIGGQSVIDVAKVWKGM
tara:strand:+ start:262 stop:516 length:255 start_codon:yes stop_codon:yes gene_type:complete